MTFNHSFILKNKQTEFSIALFFEQTPKVINTNSISPQVLKEKPRDKVKSLYANDIKLSAFALLIISLELLIAPLTIVSV